MTVTLDVCVTAVYYPHSRACAGCYVIGEHEARPAVGCAIAIAGPDREREKQQ